MKLEDIRIGDELRIRQWDDMVDEFGINDYVIIPVRLGFNADMAYMCGEKFTVSAINCGILSSIEKIEYKRGNGTYWYISADMLEPIMDELPDFEVSQDDFLDILGV